MLYLTTPLLVELHGTADCELAFTSFTNIQNQTPIKITIQFHQSNKQTEEEEQQQQQPFEQLWCVNSP